VAQNQKRIGKAALHHRQIKRWLHRRILGEAFCNLLLAGASLLAGVVSLTMTLLVLVGVTWAISERVSALGLLLFGKRPRFTSNARLAICGILAGLLFCVGIARSSDKRPFRGEKSHSVYSRLTIVASCIIKLLSAAPQFFKLAVQALGCSLRLLRLDKDAGAILVLLLLSRPGRVPYRELRNALPSGKLVPLFAGLRHVDGVVFLTSEPQGISLTAELRSELWQHLSFAHGSETSRFSCPSCGSPLIVENLDELASVECQKCGFLSRLIRGDDGQWRLAGYGQEEASLPVENETRLTQYYTCLELRSGASAEEIRRAYRRLIKANHPDVVAGLGDEARQIAEERARELNEAYDALKEAPGIKGKA